jgi:TctA family transporter
VLVVVGVLAWLGALSWFGRLPGDIRVERPGFRFYAPIVSMLIVSLVLTFLTALFRRFWP